MMQIEIQDRDVEAVKAWLSDKTESVLVVGRAGAFEVYRNDAVGFTAEQLTGIKGRLHCSSLKILLQVMHESPVDPGPGGEHVGA